MVQDSSTIHSGFYTIKNARHRNFVDFLEDRFVAGNTIPHGTGQPESMIWNVTLLDNNNYMIQNIGGTVFTCVQAYPSKGDVISVTTAPYQWTIRESGMKGQYVIFSPLAPDLYWGLRDAQFGTHVTVQNTPTNDSNQWLFQRQEISIIQCPGNSLAPPDTDVIESGVFGGNQSSFGRFHGVDDLAKTPQTSAIRRIIRIRVVFNFDTIYQISITYQLAHGEEITCHHPDSYPIALRIRSVTVEFAMGEVLGGAYGRAKHVVNQMSFVIFNTRTGAERVAGPFGGTVTWLPNDVIGEKFDFHATGRHIIAFGGRIQPEGYVAKAQLMGLTFIHRRL